jgi:hypothetical protein
MHTNNEKFLTIPHGELLYVTADGNWGSDAMVIVDINALTDEQNEVLADLRDSDKMSYVTAVVNGDDLSEWEEE